MTSADAANTGTGVISDATVTGIDPDVADPVTITFTAQLAVGVIPGQQLQNRVTGEFSSRDGDDPDERTGDDPSSDQDDDSDLDNYNEFDDAPTITAPTEMSPRSRLSRLSTRPWNSGSACSMRRALFKAK